MSQIVPQIYVLMSAFRIISGIFCRDEGQQTSKHGLVSTSMASCFLPPCTVPSSSDADIALFNIHALEAPVIGRFLITGVKSPTDKRLLDIEEVGKVSSINAALHTFVQYLIVF